VADAGDKPPRAGFLHWPTDGEEEETDERHPSPLCHRRIVTQNGNGYDAGFVDGFWKTVRAYQREQTPETEAGNRQFPRPDTVRIKGGTTMTHPNWDQVTKDHVVRALKEYDRLGPESFFATHGFAPTTTYELVWKEHQYPPKAILGTAYEFATGQRLASPDFEGGRSGAVTVLGQLGFDVEHR